MPEDRPYRKMPSSGEVAARMRAEEAELAAAVAVVESWNNELESGASALWSPTIRAAIVARRPWLDLYCPGCRTSQAIDIRKIDRHPLAYVGSLVLGYRCSRCLGVGPLPVLKGLPDYA
jgi:hypothetical protein